MQGNPNTKRRIARAKNIVRGALSNKNARPVEALAGVIETMAPDDLPAFGKWTDSYPGRRARLAPPPKITKYSNLWTGDYLPFEDLANAVRWNARILSTHRQALSEFVRSLKEYEDNYMAGQYEEAARSLDDIQDRLGLSYWLIEARIALLHRSQGLESQKLFTKALIDEVPGTITAYLFYYTSQRAEDATSIERFNARVSADIDKQAVRQTTALFLKHCLSDSRSCWDQRRRRAKSILLLLYKILQPLRLDH